MHYVNMGPHMCRNMCMCVRYRKSHSDRWLVTDALGAGGQTLNGAETDLSVETVDPPPIGCR